MEKGIAAFNAGDYEAALRLFLEAAETEPGALTPAGLASYRLGDLKGAVSLLERSLLEAGERFEARKFLSLAYYRMDETEKSISNARLALAIKEDRELEGFIERLASEQRAEANRVDEETLHFRVIFDGYRHGGISRKVLAILEEAYSAIGQEMGHFPERPVTVVLYTEKDFFDITKMPTFVAGAYDGKIRLPVKGVESKGAGQLRQVLFHEYVHALVHSITPRAPLWVNEGLAEYLVPRGFEKTGQKIPLRELENSFPLKDHRLTTLAYMESHSAVSDLAERYGLYGLKELLVALSRGKDLNQAFYSAFYVTYDDFVSSWGK